MATIQSYVSILTTYFPQETIGEFPQDKDYLANGSNFLDAFISSNPSRSEILELIHSVFRGSEASQNDLSVYFNNYLSKAGFNLKMEYSSIAHSVGAVRIEESPSRIQAMYEAFRQLRVKIYDELYTRHIKARVFFDKEEEIQDLKIIDRIIELLQLNVTEQ